MLHDLPNLTVHQLVYVQTALRARSWTDAASDLGVTQSALSQAIAEVERRLGLPLFDRRGRARVATPAGEAVGRVASDIIASIDDLSGRLAEIEFGSRGTLRIGMIDTAALGVLAEPLRQFRELYPNVRTTLFVEPSLSLTNRVTLGELDIAAVVVPNSSYTDNERAFELTPAFDEPIYVYAPPLTPKKVSRWGPWVSYPAGSQSRDLIEAALRARGDSYDVEAESSNPDVLRQMVRLGVGWCALPASVAESGSDPLKRYVSDPITFRNIGFLRRTTALENGAVTQFLALVEKGLRTDHLKRSPVKS
jgi:DNA-binding transcriptional LysR family regulator